MPWGNTWVGVWTRLKPISVGADGVQVWQADLDRPPQEVDALARTLSTGERARAGRFHRARDRDHFIAGHGLLRILLGDALGRSLSSLRFHYNAHGKPTLEGTPLAFSLSHSEGAALFALAWGRAVGVDIERVRLDIAAEALAERYLPAGESARLSALPPESRADAFTQAWVRHEAYLKALGVGLAAAATPMTVENWGCYDLEVGTGYRGALVVLEGHNHSLLGGGG